MYQEYNPNPCGKWVGDCVIRALTKILDLEWKEVYTGLALEGLKMCDMPSSNTVWGKYIVDRGYLPYTAEMETAEQFANTHPKGKYLLATGTHAIALIDGIIYDAWDSSSELISYYFKEDE